MKYLTYTIIFSKKQYFLNLMEKLFFDDFFLLFIIVMCIFVCFFFNYINFRSYYTYSGIGITIIVKNE